MGERTSSRGERCRMEVGVVEGLPRWETGGGGGCGGVVEKSNCDNKGGGVVEE